MSTLFRVEALDLHTEQSTSDRREFTTGLNLIIGSPGSGKSTMIELIRFGLGMRAQRTPVVEGSVRRVSVEIVAADRRLRLSRSVHTPGVVFVEDLDTQEDLGEFPVAPEDERVRVGTALLRWLGIPADVEVNVNGRRKVLTFDHVWEYMHVPQLEIDHSIARHDAASLTPRRKRVFDLVFGLIDERFQELDDRVAHAKAKHREARGRLEGVEAFAERADLPSPSELEDELREAERQRHRVTRALERLRSSLGARDDRVVALRGMLSSTQNAVSTANEALRLLDQTQRQRRDRLDELTASLTRVRRVRSADTFLSPIEFSQCPRCLQSLDEHRSSPGTCRLCLQPEPGTEVTRAPRAGHRHGDGQDALPLAVPDEAGPQELQLSDQLDEIRILLERGEQERRVLESHRDELYEGLHELEEEVRLLTAALGFPGSEELARVSEEVARAEAEAERISSLIRTVQHMASFTAESSAAETALRSAREELQHHQDHLRRTSRGLFADLTTLYADLLRDVNAPNVRDALIASDDYLPYIDGKKFDAVSISGGNRVPFIVSYWLALHSVALTSPNYPLPGFLVLDSPQKSLGPLQELSKNMYRLIQAMAEERDETFQVFVLDTDLPSDFTPDQDPLWLDYDHPGIRSIRHPGPTHPLRTLEGERVDDTGAD
ncbi:AAA family ATPase [Nocardiopsis aegyptia]|uniref:Putative nucleic acid-binding Zn-ribbon protein n=1 Tax=Nocardiopsis aegyptia TaxID=220378 RepID=A0A7Z0EJ44_9ACTN|nr:AAA family ATPase [Nocardiopsis aegyptia]NYJ33023.1 putative nucleic acid-binding Zn-ribbon protein [Nocardiopsis aegyptia]